MLVLDALNFGVDGALWRRAVELRSSDESIERVAQLLTKEFDLTCSHRTVVRWIAGGEVLDNRARTARAKGRGTYNRKEQAS